MSLLHPTSRITPVPEVDIFAPPPTQTAILTDRITYHRPITSLTNDATPIIIFEITSAENEYIQLRETELYIKLKISATSNNVKFTAAQWKNTWFSDNLLNCLFSSVVLSINEKEVNNASTPHQHRSYIDCLLNKSISTKQASLSPCGWYLKTTVNEGVSNHIHQYEKYTAATADGWTYELIGKLQLDLCQQERAIIGGTKLRFKLTTAPTNTFVHVSSETAPDPLNIKISIEEAILHVHRSIVSPSLLAAHRQALLTHPALYPINRVEVRHATIPAGISSTTIDNFVTGQLPRRAFIVFMTNTAFAGTFRENNQSYPHNDVSAISCLKNNVEYPPGGYKMDYDKGLNVQAYHGLLKALNQNETGQNIEWNRFRAIEAFKNIYGFNFAPDLSEGATMQDHVNLIEHGYLSIKVEFSKATAAVLSMLVYLEYDNIIEIDKDGKVTANYM